MAAKKILMNSMTSCEKEDMAGKMYGCEEDSDEFDDIT